MQLIIVAGRVGNVKDPKQVGNDTVLNFSLAASNGKDKDPTWYECEIWGKRADSLAPHIAKGLSLTVTGYPKVRVYDGKAIFGISVDRLEFGGGGKAESQQRDTGTGYGAGGSPGSQSSGRPDFDDSDIPF